MRLHHREFLGAERSGLQQDRVGDGDLPQVMKHAALIEEIAVFGSEALSSADRLRIAANTLGVMDRVPVACLDRASKGEQHSLRRIEPLTERALAEQHLGANEQLLRVEGFAQVVVRS